MSRARMFSHRKWRRTATFSIVLSSICGLLLLGFLITSLSRSGSSITQSTILFEEDCKVISKINIILHLLLNIISTAILASSNFFMQLLNAPSRVEINKAHASLRSLEIGVPSIKNLGFLSPFKLTCWLLLFVSSIPIHLFFNSAIFETSFQGGHWGLTIATEAFTWDTTFFPPGSSLAPAGSSGPMFTGVYSSPGYGDPVALSNYYDNSSDVIQVLKTTATEARSWDRLEPNECFAEYGTCTPKTKYRDVVFVVETGTNDSLGWRPSEIYESRFGKNDTMIWDQLVPWEETNPLWYSTRCALTKEVQDGYCAHSCDMALGLSHTNNNDGFVPLEANWTLVFRTSTTDDSTFKDHVGLKLRYCLAQPFANKCKIGQSNLLIFLVILCITIKVACSTLVVLRLPHTSLITPGDALVSLISNPDMMTTGLSTLGYTESYGLEYRPRRQWVEDSEEINLTLIPTPRRWLGSTHRFISTIPRAVRGQSFAIWVSSLTVVASCTMRSYKENGHSL